MKLRTPKPDSQRRNVKLTVCMTPGEYRRLEQLAALRAMRASELARRVILHVCRKL